MQKVMVRNEGKPSKCEICHQSDVFDVATQVCLRCRDLASVPSASKPVEAFSDEDRASFFKRLNAQFEDSVQQEKVFQEKAIKVGNLMLLLCLLNLGVFVGFSALSAILFQPLERSNWATYWMLVLLIIEVIIGVSIQHRHSILAKGFIFSAIFILVLIPVGIALIEFYIWFAVRRFYGL